MEGDHFVTVHVSTELLAELRDWSDPVQVKVIDTPGQGTGYDMIVRHHHDLQRASDLIAELRKHLDAQTQRAERAEAELARR